MHLSLYSQDQGNIKSKSNLCDSCKKISHCCKAKSDGDKFKSNCHEINIFKDNCCQSLIVPKKVKIGDKICIRICGFNPLIYSFQINYKDSSRKMDNIPKLFEIFNAANFLDVFTKLNFEADRTAPSKSTFDSNNSEILCDKETLKIASKLIDLTGLKSLHIDILCPLLSLLVSEYNLSKELLNEQNNWYSFFLEFNYLSTWNTSDCIKKDNLDMSKIKTRYLDLMNKISDLKLKHKNNVDEYNFSLNKYKNLEQVKKLLDIINTLLTNNNSPINYLDTFLPLDKFMLILASYENYFNNIPYSSFPLIMDEDYKIIEVLVKPYDEKVTACFSPLIDWNNILQIENSKFVVYGKIQEVDD